MGVSGLLSTCLENQDICTETADLIEVAREKNGIELIIDFYSFEHYVMQKFWNSLCHLRGNNYLRILGGEYASLDAYLTKLVNDLKSHNITLTFYIDGAKGSSAETLQQKFDTWISRHNEEVKRMTNVLEVFWGKRNIGDLKFERNIRPVVIEVQFVAVLKKCGCEIFQVAAGEADVLIIRGFQERPKAYAVLSDDSDFCVFKESRFIPVQLFDIENDLQLGNPRELPEKPVKIKVKIITNDKVMSMLEISNHSMLIDMCIVAGNDFTKHFMHGRLHRQLDLKGCRSIMNLASWINHYKSLQNHPALARAMSKDRAFRNAVYSSRNFYNMRCDPESPPKKDFSQIIIENIRSCQYTSNIMSMHNNFYWYRLLLEENSPGAPCAECAMTELRAFIYRIVLPQSEEIVNEYGRSPTENWRSLVVKAVDDARLPPLNCIIPDKISDNLKTFHAIMAHQEKGNSPNWFDRYGRKNGFIVFILRYFLLLNWGRNLNITEHEYLALVAMTYSRTKVSQYQNIVLCPPARCVTILNWYQDVYRHAYIMLGGILHIKHEFPIPSELFAGSVWTVMYMVCQDDTFRLAAQHVPLDALHKAQQEMNDIINEKRLVIRHIVEGFFSFNDQNLVADDI